VIASGSGTTARGGDSVRYNEIDAAAVLALLDEAARDEEKV